MHLLASAGISKSVKNKIYKLVSREQTIFSALKCPYFGLKINKTAFSPKFPRVSFHFLLFWLCLYVDYHFPLTEHQGHVRAGGHISQAPWGGPAEKMILFLVVFKIYFRPFWVILVKKNWVKLGVPILFFGIVKCFPAIFGFWKFSRVFDISRGQKNLF